MGRSEAQREKDALRRCGRCIYSGMECSRARSLCDFNKGRGTSCKDVCRISVVGGCSSRRRPGTMACGEFRCFLMEK